MRRAGLALAVVGAALLGVAGAAHLGGCRPGAARQRPDAVEPASPRVAVLPAEVASRAPSRAELGGADGRVLADVDTCGGCHQEIFAQQQASAHAYSSFNNPVYRVAIDRTRDEVSPQASRMCAGCHDIALLADDAIDPPVEPEDARGHAGVTCRVCHGIDSASRDGNGSYALSGVPVVLPRTGDEASVAAHRASVRPLRTAEMCGSCHRSFLDEATGNRGVFLTGQDDLGAWLGSAYHRSGLARVDDPIPEQDCIACHMPREPAPRGDAAARGGAVASHRFPGGHTWLAAMLGDEEQVARQRAFLQGSVSIDLAALRELAQAGPGTVWPVDGAAVRPGARVEVDVVVRNLRVGHRFPAGVLDAQDTWIEVTLRDARGRAIAAAGADHARTGDDPGAHVFRALVADGDGRLRLEREVHAFRAPVANHTIGPRDAVAIRYRFDVPATAGRGGPLALDARVVHRSRNLALQRAACAAATSARGRRFADRARELDDPVLDPCAPQPLTILASTGARLVAGSAPAAPAAPIDPRQAWRRRYEHGLALLGALQEDLEEAREPLLAALELIGRDPTAGPRERAGVLVALGRLDGQASRTDAALAWLDRAEALVPGHAAVASARGAALARVWRWPDAAVAFAAATGRARDNAGAWSDLAVALGALGRDEQALAAAQRGLALAPRDGDLLRVQAIALAGLSGPAGDAARALDAFERHRAPDVATDLRYACSARDARCALERDPLHAHELEPVRSAR